ncbi:hypothetical protein M3Y97_01148200 [Aphelenchoides bicaudatus]|nr:hypothetical protein M3Y97_01148200 [Aphelenchoides bicaudatus]
MSSANKTNQLLNDPVFYVHCGTIGLYVPAFLLQATILYKIQKYRLVHSLSANLIINIICWVLFLFLGLCLTSYLFHGQNRPVFVLITLVGLFAAAFTTIAAVLEYVPRFPTYTDCKSGGCLLSVKAASIIFGARTCIGLLTILAAVVFNIVLYLIAFMGNDNMSIADRVIFRRSNQFAMIACVMELTFKVAPQMVNIILMMLGTSLINVLAGLLEMLVGIEALFTALIYRHLIMQRANLTPVIPIQTVFKRETASV